MNDRRSRIEEMLQEEPHDPFLRYALALEQEKVGEHDASLAGLRSLMADQPPYVAAYLMAAQQLVKLERIEEARGVLREGIEAARSAENHHAAAEMGELLSSLGILG